MAGRRKRRPTADDARPFAAMDQAIAVFEALAERPDGLTCAELAAAIDVAPWNVERVVQSLHEARFVAGGAPRWRLSLRAVGLAYRFMWTLDWKHYYVDALEALSTATGELAQIAVVNDTGLVAIDKVEGRHALRVASVVGTDIPPHATAGGKAWLASLDAAALDRALARWPLVSFTARTITERPVLAAELAAIRANGFAVGHEEYYPGVSAVAAAIRPDGHDLVVGAVSVAFPSSLPAETVTRYAEATMRCAADLTPFGIRVQEEMAGHRSSARSRAPQAG
jgi:IclR family acetate operon transcriptional repressor